MKKRWVKIVVAVAAVVIVVLCAVPLLINADAFRPKLEDELSSTMGRKITLGHLSLSLLTGSLVADNISVADDPAFATEQFLEAKELRIGIALGSFIFQRKVRITSFTVDSPAIHLIHGKNGTWNFSSLGGAASKPAAQNSGSQHENMLSSVSIGEIKIKNGSTTVSSLPATGKPFTCTEINLSAQQIAFTQPFPFQLSVTLPGGGSFQLSGTAGPVAQNDASQTPFQATLHLKHFDPVAAGAVEPSEGISMITDFDAQLDSDGTNLTSNGKIVATKLKLSRSGSPAPQPVDIDYTISDNLQTHAGKVTDIAIHNGSATAHLTGSFRGAETATDLDLHFSAPNQPIDQLEQLLPAVGVILPTGSKLQGGTLSANLAITGTTAATEISGPVSIDNTQLTGFNLGSKIEGINPLGGTSNGTQIQKLGADLKSTPQSTQISNIDVNVPQIGNATGSGTVSAAGALDFQLVAKFSSSSLVGGLANSGFSRIEGRFGNNSNTAANSGIPLTISGTTSNPVIRANIKSMLKQEAGGLPGNSSGQQGSPVSALKGFFHK